MTLFDHASRERIEREAPLAARMRPRSFDEFVGQGHVVGPGRVLRRAIEADQIPSLLLWGPPGSGKTTLANLIAGLTSSHFEPVSAVTAGVADLRRVAEAARERRAMHGQRTILFVDEIHRFNKAQQDVILPHVENGTVVFIGATTENPSFEVIAPLLSRSRVFALRQLEDDQLRLIVERALGDADRGLGELRAELAPEAMGHLVAMSNGDARVALNGLELAVSATEPDGDGLPAASPWPPSKRPSSSARSCTTRRETSTTTPSPPSSSPSEARTPMRASTGSPECWRRARTRCSSPAVSSSWRRRTLAWRTPWPCR